MKKYFAVFLTILCASLSSFAITSNPIISSGRPAYVSPAGTSISYMTDNTFTGSAFTVANGSWIAIDLGASYNEVFIAWNNPNYTWFNIVSACLQTIALPVDYTLESSTNTTNGSDGTWTVVKTVTGNSVTTRGDSVDLEGGSWIRMNISNGGGTLNEIEVFDLSSNGDDLWFFPGTSISANTYKGTPPANNFADLIKTYTNKTPAMVRGGIPCINSTDFKNNLSTYLSIAGNVKYWAIEMGTNDGYNNGAANVTTFTNNMQYIITQCKAAGIEPILARVIATNQASAGWQIHPNYKTAVDNLTSTNSLITGPDLYTYFVTHPTELNSDGIHPNATGAASIQRLWANKLSYLFGPIPNIDVTIGATPLTSLDTRDFGTHPSGTSDTTLTFTITNSGTVDLKISSIVVGGTDANQFTLNTTGTSLTVAASSSTTFSVSFTPTSEGAKTAMIVVANNDSDEDLYVVNLTGTATPATIVNDQVSVFSKLNFYPNPSSEEVTIEMTLKSPSDMTVTLSDLTGKKLMTLAEGKMSEWNKTFSVAHLKKGVYTINYYLEGTPVRSEQLVVK